MKRSTGDIEYLMLIRESVWKIKSNWKSTSIAEHCSDLAVMTKWWNWHRLTVFGQVKIVHAICSYQLNSDTMYVTHKQWFCLNRTFIEMLLQLKLYQIEKKKTYHQLILSKFNLTILNWCGNMDVKNLWNWWICLDAIVSIVFMKTFFWMAVNLLWMCLFVHESFFSILFSFRFT